MHLRTKDPKLNKQNGMPTLIGMQKLPKTSRVQNSFIKRLVTKG